MAKVNNNDICISLICFFLIYFSKILNEYITNFLSPRGDLFKILYDLSIVEEYKQEQILHGNLDILLTIFLAPIYEEFLFRWIFFQKMLNYGLSEKKSIFVSSFLFGFSHINLWQCITAFLIGSLIGIIYYRTKSIFVCILSHSLNNIITIIFTFLCKKNSFSRLWFSAFFSFIGLYLTLYLFLKQTTYLCK